jgi:hypothetical protein
MKNHWSPSIRSAVLDRTSVGSSCPILQAIEDLEDPLCKEDEEGKVNRHVVRHVRVFELT